MKPKYWHKKGNKVDGNILLIQSLYLCILFGHCQSKKSTTLTPGFWSKWGPWQDCSKTCGIGVRRRIRFCSYTGTRKEQRCKGNIGQMKNCDTKSTCPIHGGWSTWVSWSCTATCGGGKGEQRRSCTNPKPMFGGKDCEGPTEEKGKCNTQRCPDQDYPLSSLAALELEKSINEYHNLKHNENETAQLTCSRTVISKLFEEYPKTSLTWKKNGKFLKIDHDRMEMTLKELIIRKLRVEDNGVYVCSVNYAPQVVKSVTVVALAVVSSKPDIKIHEKESFKLVCDGKILRKLFQNVTQKWFINDTEYKDSGLKNSINQDIFEVNNAKRNLSGKWSCKIEDSVGKRTWTTNIVIVKILSPMSGIQWFFSNRKMILMFFVSLLILFTIFGIIVSSIIKKTREDYANEFEKWKQIVKWEEMKENGVPKWALLKEEETTSIIESESDEDFDN